jgi:uncharacterized C2H2 Zn-finger protein
MTTPVSCNKEETLTFITLGDGDFSYSLDMAKYLASETNATHRMARQCHIVATGIDSLDELHAKYRDASFLLKGLDALNRNSKSVSVTIYHGVNAVEPPPSTSASEINQWKAHHVIFNHPHIGTEDAALHSRFLSHFLYIASRHWMRPGGGVLHLTLVKGQYERWNCNQAAMRHDLVLLERNPFLAPPDGGHYQHRRHQTGKSFASRATGGSETFTFGRRTDTGKYIATRLPWLDSAAKATIQEFPCPHCEKTFGEERSQKSHVEAVHDPSNKRKRVEALPCLECQALDIVRVFPHEQALHDHMRAKHTSLHSHIQPDWAKEKTASSQVNNEGASIDSKESDTAFGSCRICGIVYQSAEDESRHYNQFIPRPVSEIEQYNASVTHQCSFCDRSFRDHRAQLQHENSCFERSRTQKQVHHDSKLISST